MVVNLSLEKSARFILNTKVPNERLFVISSSEDNPYFTEILSHNQIYPAMKGTTPEQIRMAEEKAYWLAAGQGVLIKCSGISGE